MQRTANRTGSVRLQGARKQGGLPVVPAALLSLTMENCRGILIVPKPYRLFRCSRDSAERQQVRAQLLPLAGNRKLPLAGLDVGLHGGKIYARR